MSDSKWLWAIPFVSVVALSCSDDGGTGGAGGASGSTSTATIGSSTSGASTSTSGSTSSSSQSSSSASTSSASSSTSSSASSSSASAVSSVASSSSSGGGAVINGCAEALATDLTGLPEVKIQFPNLNFSYDPSCFKVSAGTILTFQGTFLSHPLAGGANPPTVDATSPITVTSSGMSQSFTMTTPGGYGFFCENHYTLGMKGAVFVE